LNGLKLFISSATAQAARQPDKLFENSGLTRVPFIKTDSALARLLVGEFQRRGLALGASNNDIAVIAEWDTAYGRGMFPVFRDAVVERLKEQGQSVPEKGRVHSYAYLRGLDGKRPGEKKGGPTSESSVLVEGRQGGAATASPTSKEGEGNPQIDYLRRLVERLKTDEIEHRRQYKAIGVVGSDVYDKLLLLEALRPAFPGALFFTTDLDVRLLQPGDYAKTRNLLVASHYGLSLTGSLQGRTAPFRSGYDTASYLACLNAVGYPDSLVCCFDLAKQPPRLYEIGRGGANEISPDRGAPGQAVHAPDPRAEPWITRDGHHWWLLLAAAVVGLIIYPVSRPWQRFLRFLGALLYTPFALLLWGQLPADLQLTAANPRPQARSPGKGDEAADPRGRIALQFVTLVAVVLSLAFAFGVYRLHQTPDEEPFHLFEGISVWPAEALRLLACLLSAYFVVAALDNLHKRNVEIRTTFLGVGNPKKLPGKELRTYLGIALGLLWWEPRCPTVRPVWRRFETYGKPCYRLIRTVLLSLLYLGLLMIFWLFLFEPISSQARGAVTRILDGLLLFLAGGTLVGLIMFVVDATHLCYRLVEYLSRYAQTWPLVVLRERAYERGLALDNEGCQALGCWLTVRLIAEATAVTARLLYYPFIVLLILVVAQSSFFDNWHWHVPLIVAIVLSAATALICALLLQRAAKSAKDKALRTLNGLIVERIGPEEDLVRAKLEQLRAEIEKEQAGAFASFTNNPVVWAILIPLGGGGGVAALQALLMYL
jgi:hypothetical protein